MVAGNLQPKNLQEAQGQQNADERVDRLMAALGREDVTAALAEIGVPAVGPLIQALRHRPDGLVKYNAALALTKMGTPAVRGLLLSVEDAEPDVRAEACWALGEIGDERALDPLIAGLRDEDWGVRRNAAASLAKMGNKKAIPPLIMALGDEDWQHRKSVV